MIIPAAPGSLAYGSVSPRIRCNHTRKGLVQLPLGPASYVNKGTRARQFSNWLGLETYLPMWLGLGGSGTSDLHEVGAPTRNRYFISRRRGKGCLTVLASLHEPKGLKNTQFSM